jgi:hypothetical protein
MSVKYTRSVAGLFAACAMAAMGSLSLAEAAGPRRPLDTFTATTANMTPAGTNLRMQIIEWQDEAARTEAVASLAAGADAATPFGKLPTVGYVWPNGSPVGYSLKYAHREPLPDGGERITLVTDRRLGSYDFKGWSVASPAVNNDHTYSVIELSMSATGSGTGTMSLAGDVALDEAAGTVALAGGGTPMLLANVKREAAAHRA